ncbi:hypothetical protein [Guggenheimella bovis]
MEKIIYEGKKIERLVDQLITNEPFVIMDFEAVKKYREEDFLIYIDNLDQLMSLKRLDEGSRVFLEKNVRKGIQATDYPALRFQKSLLDKDAPRLEFSVDGDVKRIFQFLKYLSKRYDYCIGVEVPEWLKEGLEELSKKHPTIGPLDKQNLRIHFGSRGEDLKLLFWDGSSKELARWRELFGPRLSEKALVIHTKPFLRRKGWVALPYYGFKGQAKRIWTSTLAELKLL